jgi:hypothetical protein
MVARVALADPAACEPACASGQACVDGACAPAASGVAAGTAGTPKVAASTARPSASAPRWREGFLFLPSIGVSSFQGDSGRNMGPGLRVGALLGSRLAENWSLNIGAAFDLGNMNPPAGASLSGYFLDIGFNPLVHFPQPKFEVVAGPILGTWAQYGHASAATVYADTWGYGWTFGLNAGVLFPVGTHAEIGGLVNLLLREPLKVCTSVSGGTDTCTSDNIDSVKTLALALAAMF